MGHIILFAGLSWAFAQWISMRWRTWPLWCGMAGLAALIEWVQPWVGRSCELLDWIFGVLGAGVICFSWKWNGYGRQGLLFICLFAIVWGGYGIPIWMEKRSYPIVIDFGRIWGMQRWEKNSVDMSADILNEIPVTQIRVKETTHYPGVFRSPAEKNWGDMSMFCAELYWAQPTPGRLWVRMDDKVHTLGYFDRVQKDFDIFLGWNRIFISKEELTLTPDGRSFDWEHIYQFGFFLESAKEDEIFYLGRVWLELQTKSTLQLPL